MTRQTVSDLLDVGVSGLLTVVMAPTGAGKTMSVATWAASADLSGGVVWLNLAGANADRDLFWTRLRRAFVEAGARHLPSVPDAGCAESLRTRMLEDSRHRTARQRPVGRRARRLPDRPAPDRSNATSRPCWTLPAGVFDWSSSARASRPCLSTGTLPRVS